VSQKTKRSAKGGSKKQRLIEGLLKDGHLVAIVQGLFDLVRELAFDSDSRSQPLHHYTTARGLLGIVSTSTVFATAPHSFADATEWEYGKETLKAFAGTEKKRLINDEIDELVKADIETSMQELVDIGRSKAGDKLRVSPYVFSLSSIDESASQWNGYADSGRGFVVSFDPKLLAQAGLLCKVVYGPREARATLFPVLQQFVERAAKLLASRGAHGASALLFTPNIAGLLKDALSVRIKDPAFRSEAEWRLVALSLSGPGVQSGYLEPSFREGDGRLAMYVPRTLPPGTIRRILVGPRNDFTSAKTTIYSLLHKAGLDPTKVTIEQSKIKLRYRDTQKRARLEPRAGRFALGEPRELRDALAEVGLGDDRVAPVDRLRLVAGELHRDRAGAAHAGPAGGREAAEPRRLSGRRRCPCPHRLDRAPEHRRDRQHQR